MISRAIYGAIRVTKPKIPYWGILYHITILMSMVCLGIYNIVR